MSPNILFIFYVSDQNRSATFYKSVLGKEPVLDVPGMTEFALSQGTSLGIMPEKGVSSFLGDDVPKPEQGNGIPRCELYLLVEDPGLSLARISRAGGRQLSDPQERPWGDVVGYGLDPDGHVLAFALNKD